MMDEMDIILDRDFPSGCPVDPELPAASSDSPDPLARFVEIEHRLREIAEEEERLKKERQSLEQTLLDQWADRGQQRATVGGLTVYVRQDFYCNKRAGVPTQRVCEILQMVGLGAMVAEAYNAQSLKARVKEMVAEDQVPAALEEVLAYDTIPRLVAVRS